MASLLIDSLSHHFGQRQILSSLSMTLDTSVTCCAILGPSGCGKTTLLRLIAGLEAVQEGKIVLTGDDITHVEPPARRVGMVFQQPALFPHMTAFQNIAFGVTDVAKGKEKKVTGLLELIGLADKADHYPHQLSGGEQHRISLARSIASDIRLLLLDEAFSHLDVSMRAHLRDETLTWLRELHIPAVMVTHDPQEALAVADYLVVMDDQGRIRQQGTPKEVYDCPADSYVIRSFGEVNLLDADRHSSLIEALVGKKAELGVYAVRAQDITLSKTGVKAQIRDVHFMGSYCRIVAVVEKREELLLHVSAACAVEADDTVYLAVDAKKVIKLDS